ncbi:DUF1345 domain-containing protein [Cellulomonas gelida]|uniref:Uncharacterized protein n=1 Tax=Cellulomonas gelida TaxID=1712 RepID=A0A4Y3KGL6_9CELL|nr:DUF1345 domain-containing protein [Cellulomonas gelida]GEA83157.1 hypothetical protein CGE01nite_04080 [Cellulomonas gelida]GGL29718.1 hypothetical protein GCM10009774_20100 [Cellulomonas gelida]
MGVRSMWRQIRRSAQGEDAESTPGPAAREMESNRWSAVTALVISAFVSVGVLAAIVLLLQRLNTDQPTAALSLVFVAAAVVLILVVGALSVILKRLRLDNGHEAMGLPTGSVRAVIALLLIMLFFISAMFLFDATRNRVSSDPASFRSLEGLSTAQLAQIPIEQVQTSTQRLQDGTTVYDVVLYPPPTATRTSDDLAKQLVTTVATLVTAVAAFYFGSNTVTTARAEQRAQEGLPPSGAVLLPPAKGPQTPTTAADTEGTAAQPPATAPAGQTSTTPADPPGTAPATTPAPATSVTATPTSGRPSAAARPRTARKTSI